MADEPEQKQYEYKLNLTGQDNDNISVRHSVPAVLNPSLTSAKRFGVADFNQLGDDGILDEFDPLKESEKTTKNGEKSTSLLNVCDDKSLARHSAPGLLFGSQSEEDDENDLGATGISHFGSQDLLDSTHHLDLDQNNLHDDMQNVKKELERMDTQEGNNDSTPVYPSLSSTTDLHSIARHRIVSVSGSDKSGRLAIVFSACRIPPLHQIDHHKLLQYIKHTLDQYVESDYSIVYFHYGLSSKNKPSFNWLLQVYRELERKYRKNVKAMYIVHPSNFIKIAWTFFSKVISNKFAKKVAYVNCLQELSEHVHLKQLDIPGQVLKYDAGIMTRYKPKTAASSVFHADIPEIPTTQQFGVSLTWIKENNNGCTIPICISTSVIFLTEFGLEVEGIFRRSANSSVVKRVAEMFNLGTPVDFSEFGDVHCAAAIIKKFLRELPEPLLTYELCEVIPSVTVMSDRNEKLMEIWRILHRQIPAHNFELLQYIMLFLKQVQSHPINKMTASNLAIVFGPNLVWGKSQAASLDAMAQINTFTCLMLENIDYLFIDGNT